MRLIARLIDKNYENIKQEKWYLQHFDAAPFFINLINPAELRAEKRKFAGGEFMAHVVWFENKTCDWYISQADIHRISELIFRQSFKLKKITNQKKLNILINMEKQNKLIKINFAGLRDRQWYHQQGDGCPFFCQALFEPYTQQDQRRLGLSYADGCLYFKDQLANFYQPIDQLNAVTKKITKASAAQPASKSLMKKWAGDEKRFLVASKKMDKINLSKLTNSQLKKLFIDYIEKYFKAISSSSIIDGFALGTDELLQKEIKDFLSSRGWADKQHEYFTVLTAPVTSSFINAAEVSLLKCAQLIQNNNEFKDILSRSLTDAADKVGRFAAINRALSIHVKNYFWVKNNYYSAYILTVKDFLEEIRGILAGRVDLAKEIGRIITTPATHRREKEKLIKEIGLPKFIQILLTISEDFTYWQDERKKKTLLMDHYGTLFLKEFSRRFNYAVDDQKFFVYDELLSLFGKKSVVSGLEANRRRQACLYYQKGDQYDIVSGPEAEQLKKKLFDAKQQELVNDFRGLPASRGRVRGKVKILHSVNEINKIEQGDILVAVMTRPDYVPAIKKAAAIITDEGGVTCHAAIISRELGIPCVIGTKIATKILKDGDEVEVNANHGVVTVIKR